MIEQVPYPKVKSRYWYALLLLAASVSLAWIAYSVLNPGPYLTVSFLDVGQGDASFFRTYAGVQVLIDGGPDQKVLQKLGSTMPFYDRTIDLIVLTHPHADHLMGLIEVLKRYKVKRILMSEITHNSESYKELKSVITEKKIKVVQAQAGMIVKFDKNTYMHVLYPFAQEQGQLFADLNETSIMARLCFGVHCFLFTGDAPLEEEKKVLATGQPVTADVLKIGHHGSKNSTSEQFLRAVNPKFAVITVGKKNKYGLPDQQVLDGLSSKSISIIRTDEAGDVIFKSDGKILERVK